MIKNVFSKQFGLLFILSVLFLTSCVRERDTDTDMSAELAMHEFLFHDASEIADDAATKSTGENLSNYKTRGYCATLTHDKINNPRTIIIDFGNSNCMCNDGRERRGKILVSYTDTYEDSGSVHTINFDNYFVNDHHVMGSNIITHNGFNGSAQPFYTSIINGKVLKPFTADTLYYEANRTITLVQGSDTPVWGDDIYQITGYGSGRNALRTYYAMTISQPLFKEVLGCRFINKGRIEMQPQGKALRTIDFGDGSCDNDATVTINTKVFNIKL
ncbi:MAG TPA: hypothetical protein PLU17_02735 [Chitinophagaceae bacterium]|nr:hypothetical protein [Chitinophagaceae bacterium]